MDFTYVDATADAKAPSDQIDSTATTVFNAPTAQEKRRGLGGEKGTAGNLIHLIPNARFGNLCLMYWATICLATKFKLPVATPWPLPEWVECTFMRERPDDRKCAPDAQTTEINDSNFADWITRDISQVPAHNYILRGYFQFLSHLEPHASFLRDCFTWKEVDPIDEDSICIHCRGTDHGGGSLIVASEFFASILEKEKFKHLHIITDDKFCDPLFSALRKWNPEIRCSPNAMDDFNWMRQHRKIIIPNSTFSLVAAITGHAWNGGTIYQFKRGQCIPYIQQTLSRAIQVDGKFLREARQ